MSQWRTTSDISVITEIAANFADNVAQRHMLAKIDSLSTFSWIKSELPIFILESRHDTSTAIT